VDVEGTTPPPGGAIPVDTTVADDTVAIIAVASSAERVASAGLFDAPAARKADLIALDSTVGFIAMLHQKWSGTNDWEHSSNVSCSS
jgi:hypothetical protein